MEKIKISSLKDLEPYFKSEDYKIRFIGEVLELDYRLQKLESMLNKTDEERGFTLTTPIHLLEAQSDMMRGLYNIFTIRATLENIEIPEVEYET
jgi:hypothetical protein